VVRRIPIRAKVAGALAVPLLALTVAAGVGVTTNTSYAREVSRQAELAMASIGHAGVVGSLQDERNLAVVNLLLEPGWADGEVPDPAATRERTDDASVDLGASLAGHSDDLRDDYRASMETLSGLQAVREQVDAGMVAPGLANLELAHQVFGSYTTMVESLFASHDRFALAVDDSGLRQGDHLVHYASHAVDETARLVELLLYIGSGPGGIDEPREAAELAELRRDIESRHSSIEVNGTGPYAEPVDTLLADPAVTALHDLTNRAISEGGPVDPLAVLNAAPLDINSSYVAFQDEVVELLDARAATLRDQADTRRRLYAGGALALLAAALVIAWWISRTITRPMRELSVKAREIATHRLPVAVQGILEAPPGEDLVIPESDPIVVRARDEVADVASAFNDVQSAALGLAVEQAALRRNVAESYVNLGRRNQNLLSRLVSAVGELEADETDPSRLTQIRKLDHLATRIRRNAESLLVLSHAGNASGDQGPVTLDDVVRAALGEIENHERVMVRSLDPILVHGRASADLAHLLAELIENGLRHSPPRELVEVNGQKGGLARGYRLTIIDHGLGMTPDDIERANQRLAGAESFAVTPAKYLGHYVTAVLAARHDIEVSLQGSVVVGIAARVDIPEALLTEVGTAGVRAAARAGVPSIGAGAGLPARPSTAAPGVGAPGETDYLGPSAADVREAVERLRTLGRPAAPSTAPAGRATLAPAPVPGPIDEGGRLPGWARPIPALPAGSQNTGNGEGEGNSAGDRPDGLPERTASGLVRRVRGAHVPRGVAAAQASDPPAGTTPAGEHGAPEAPDGPSSVPVDGSGIQTFLTSLADGVQRSLDGQGSEVDAEDEVRDAH
jgi:HAMP domain-containing protein